MAPSLYHVIIIIIIIVVIIIVIIRSCSPCQLSQILSHVVITLSPACRNYHPHFTEEESEAQITTCKSYIWNPHADVSFFLNPELLSEGPEGLFLLKSPMYFCLLPFGLEIYLNGCRGEEFVMKVFLLILQLERKSAGRICWTHSWKQNCPWLYLWRCGQCTAGVRLILALSSPVSRSHVSWCFSQVFREIRLLIVGFGFHRYAEGLRSLEVMSVLRNANQAARELA